ncbi:heme A synthase [Vandammella animalimorsus]|uniref:Heme A synthase n=1 Tax=Vandammella animalimorsus TaxID=2029117 RepID=A0A2A2T373_9BURK|nr:COX15/CtaA family protein [Vandammella animalimorsus]PAT31108.1 heme A synthase [Vandammella animalimorsus]PAX15897.1 heme A synthase [Vandammella animalimorsus]PAX17726.1 heme A synthase [Vandammella animalimorsus]
MDTDIALYDWSPLLHLLLVGAAVAALPLLWVWRRHRARGTRGVMYALTLMTLVLTFDLVMFGAFTRLTDSGLGCPDWPGCYGHASPVGAQEQISAAQQAQPDGPVTHKKAWIEMVHRYLATGVGALIVVLTALAWRYWLRWGRQGEADPVAQALADDPDAIGAAGAPQALRKPVHPIWPTLTLLWVCLQGAFGAWTVTMKLLPAIVTLHLLGGMVLLALLGLQAAWWQHRVTGRRPVAVRPGYMLLASLVFVALFVQIALGGWVSTNYAVLACSTFPDCNGAWWPQMDLRQGFTIWRELGHQGDGGLITFEALVGIHYVHRLFALALLMLGGWLVAVLWRHSAPLRRLAQWLLVLLVLQLLTGLSNVVLDWPLLVAVLHTGGAGALVVVLTRVLASMRMAKVCGTTPFFTESNLARQVDTRRNKRGQA